MKRNKLIYTIMFVCTLVATSCSNEEDINLPVTKGNIRFNFSDSGVHNTVSTKAATDKEYQTTFEEGDKIGLYVFANEETTTPIEGYNNVCLTYQNGEWVLTGEEGSASLDYDTQLKDAVFHAYYPYQENVTLSGTPNSPFTTLISDWEISSARSYTENDLMTGSGHAGINRNDITVSIPLKHEMAMIVVGLSGGTTYKFTNKNPELSDYTASSGEATFSINTDDMTTAMETVDGKYRFLVKPDTDATLNVTYGGKTYKQSVNIPASKYQEYSVGSNSSSEPIEFELSVGDYYCSDGTLIESDAELTDEIKAKIIGVVYYVGNPQPGSTGLNYNTSYIDILAAEHPSCTHGLVYAIKSANTDGTIATWGGVSFGGDKVSDYYTTYNYAVGTANKYIWETSKSNYEARILGYDYTAVLKANGSDFPNLFEFLDKADAPSVSSGWYLPSYGELILLAKGELKKSNQSTISIETELVKTSLSKIGAEALFEKEDAPYASSTFTYSSKDTFANKIQAYKNEGGQISGTALPISENTFPHNLRFSLAF